MTADFHPMQPQSPAPTDRSCIARSTGLVLIFGIAWWNWREPMLRFSWIPLNDLAFMVVLLLPVVSMRLLWRVSNRPLRWTALAILALPALAGILLSLLTAFSLVMEFIDEKNSTFETVRRVRTEHHDVAVYNWHGGATASSGVVVRHELEFMPGIRLVRDIYHAYPANDVRLDFLPNGQAMFDERETVSLRRHVWF
jgi:hypothetical protein